MFQHRTNGKKPSDAFFDHFKSKIWHSPPRPTWETFRLGEDVYVTNDEGAPSTVYVGSETCYSPRDNGPTPTLLTPLFFDEAAFDLEEPRLQSTDTSDVLGGCPFENLRAWDQIHRLGTHPCLLSPTASSEKDSVPFSGPLGLSPGNIECPSFKDPPSSMKQTCPEPRRAVQTASLTFRSVDEEVGDSIDLYNQVAALSYSSKRSRFLTTLNAPMACTHDRRDERTTYLDRDQAYLITVYDSSPSPVGMSPPKYRTSIQVSFENDEQKRRSEYYWKLWQSSHLGKNVTVDSIPLKGLEFASSSAVFTEIEQNVNIRLENTSIDRFTFTWTTMLSEHPQCQFAVSFHFVSTDFSQAKGVKGVPLRLSALTREITLASMKEVRNDLQISHCLIKVYRNHGAERKKAIDLKQIEKKLKKVRQQIANQENALMAKVKRDQRKHQQVLSEDSLSKTDSSADHPLIVELKRLEVAARTPEIFTAFDLQGIPEDYSDRCTLISKEDPSEFLNMSIDQPWSDTTALLSMQLDSESDVVDPHLPPSKVTVSTNLPMSSGPNELSTFETALGLVSPISNPRLDLSLNHSPIQVVPRTKSPFKPVKWIKVIDADPSYRPPEQPPPKSALCLYVRVFHPYRDCTIESYYRAAYLKQCTVRELIACIADRCDLQISSSNIISAFHVSAVGKVTMVDNKFVSGMTDEQDMDVELMQAGSEDPKKSPRTDNSVDIMDICVEPDDHALGRVHKWHLKLRY